MVEAEEFVLRDANGKVRAELSMYGTQPSLKLRDAANRRSGIGAQPAC
jgi:hypothetical protein